MTSKPRNSPEIIYWVEARYNDQKPSLPGRRPLGGKFTRRDMAERRRLQIVDAGGDATIYQSHRLKWEVLDAKTE